MRVHDDYYKETGSEHISAYIVSNCGLMPFVHEIRDGREIRDSRGENVANLAPGMGFVTAASL